MLKYMFFRKKVLAILLILGGVSTSVQALKFNVIENGDALLVYDCGALGKEDCRPYEEHFSAAIESEGGVIYVGDAQRLKDHLSRKNFGRIYLISGGGNLLEGVRFGEVLRAYRSYVVVPKGYHCVSACTVAFLGGAMREVQPGGSYQVHAYSAKTEVNLEELNFLMSRDGEFFLDAFVKRNADGAKFMAKTLMMYFQTMIGGEPSANAIDRSLSGALDFKRRYHDSGDFKKDLLNIREEGAGTMQEVFMKIEREAFMVNLKKLKADEKSLGNRASSAIKMLEAMFASRIAGTFELDQVSLRELGYVNVRKP